MNALFNNYKTTIAAVISAVVTLLSLLNVITPAQAAAILGVAAAFGFSVAQDAKK
jgi:hypothetical protein